LRRGEPDGLSKEKTICATRVYIPFLRGGALVPRQTAEEFLLTLLETLDDLPPALAQRFADVLKKGDVDRAPAIRQLFEDVADE
jgi:hypothetical protein